MPDYNSDEIKDLQSAVLGTKLDEAGFTGIGPSAQRTLPTTSEKIVTRALNAHERSLDLNEVAVNSLGARYFNVVGNEFEASKKNFDSLGGNLIDTVFSLKKAISPPGIEYSVKSMQDKSIFIATADGNDASDGSTPARALKTMGEVNELAKNGCSLTLNVYKYKTEEVSDPKAVPPEHNPYYYSYAIGDRVSCLYTYERLRPGEGDAPAMDPSLWDLPSLFAVHWRFVCVDEVDHSISVSAWNENASYVPGDIVSIAGISQFSPRVTYICLAANTGAQPLASVMPSEFWCPISAHNPILDMDGEIGLAGLSGLAVHSAGQFIIALGSISIERCGILDCQAPLCVSGEVSVASLSNARFESKLFAAGLSLSFIGNIWLADELAVSRHVKMSNNAQASLAGDVLAGTFIEHTSAGNVHYAGNVTVDCTDSQARSAITISAGTRVAFVRNINATAFGDGAGNEGIGLAVYSGSYAKIGTGNENDDYWEQATATFKGFQTAVSVDKGATIENYTAQTLMHPLGCQQAIGINVGRSGTYIKGKMVQYFRYNLYGFPDVEMDDKIEPTGAYIDRKSSTNVSSGNLIDATVYDVASEIAGYKIKTDISSEETGILRLEFKAWSSNSDYMMYDTSIECLVFAYFGISSSLQQLNKGGAMRAASLYIDTDNTWSIYFGGTQERSRVDALATFVSLPSNTSPAEYSQGSLTNRVSSIVHVMESNAPRGNETGFTAVNQYQLKNTLLTAEHNNVVAAATESNLGWVRLASDMPLNATPEPLLYATNRTYAVQKNTDDQLVVNVPWTEPKSMYKEIFVATGDGDDYAFQTDYPTRENSFRTLHNALSSLPRSASAIVHINKYKAIPNIGMHSFSINYAVGDRCSYGGYAYERVVAGYDSTYPDINMSTPWKHINIIAPSKGTFSESVTYWPGDSVLHDGLTYICYRNNTGQTPSTNIDFEKYWHVCGEYNPFITYSAGIGDMGSVYLRTDDNLEIICTGEFNIKQNKFVEFGSQLFVGGALNIYYNGVIDWIGKLNNGKIFAQANSTITFSSPVSTREQMWFHTCGNVVFYSAIHATPTANVGIQASHSTRLLAYGSIDLQDNNGGSGINASDCATIIIYGNCKISGYAYQISATAGGTVENNSASCILGKGEATGTAVGIYVDNRSKFITSARTPITRNDGITDWIYGTFVEYE
ncbi:MAG: hypothetical protein FWG30_11955 [Eubacteriaceae bacterium]|nr:hypothetical protein [Eubacteriaceae bacterium]